MVETDHAANNYQVMFRYILRLLAVDEARQFENHFTSCDECAAQLKEITRFFELLRASLNFTLFDEAQRARDIAREQRGQASEPVAQPAGASDHTIQEVLRAPEK